MTTGSAQAKAAGLTISEMARILHTHRNTLVRWSKTKPILFNALLEWCAYKKRVASSESGVSQQHGQQYCSHRIPLGEWGGDRKMSYESIKEAINNLKIDANETEMDALNSLHSQFDRAGSARWTRDELSEEIKQENDVLTHFDQDTLFYENVRSIQDSIIVFFGEESN